LAQVWLAMEKNIVSALSWARTSPQEAAAVLSERLSLFKGKDYFPKSRGGVAIVTKEGVAAVQEAVAFLQKQAPLEGVGSVNVAGLAAAAADHVADIGTVGTASHTSSDGAGMVDRVRRYGKFKALGEELWYGTSIPDARDVVLDLIVDDGVPDRAHRKGIYNAIYAEVGVAIGHHSTFGQMVGIVFALRLGVAVVCLNLAAEAVM